MNFESEIAALEDKLRLAISHSDLSALDSLIADDLLFMAPDGSALSKTGSLELHRSGCSAHLTTGLLQLLCALK